MRFDLVRFENGVKCIYVRCPTEDRQREPKRFQNTTRSYCSHFVSNSVYFMRNYYLMLLLRSAVIGRHSGYLMVYNEKLVTSLCNIHWLPYDAGWTDGTHTVFCLYYEFDRNARDAERERESNIIAWSDWIVCRTVSGSIWLNPLTSPYRRCRFNVIAIVNYFDIENEREKTVRFEIRFIAHLLSKTMSFRYFFSLLYSFANSIVLFIIQFYIFRIKIISSYFFFVILPPALSIHFRSSISRNVNGNLWRARHTHTRPRLERRRYVRVEHSNFSIHCMVTWCGYWSMQRRKVPSDKVVCATPNQIRERESESKIHLLRSVENIVSFSCFSWKMDALFSRLLAARSV